MVMETVFDTGAACRMSSAGKAATKVSPARRILETIVFAAFSNEVEQWEELLAFRWGSLFRNSAHTQLALGRSNTNARGVRGASTSSTTVHAKRRIEEKVMSWRFRMNRSVPHTVSRHSFNGHHFGALR